MTKPQFFVFDGVDGAGKSTQIERFRTWLESRGHDVTLCRDPGTTELGEKIRALLLQSTDIAIGFRAEMLLYMAARAQLVEQMIRPALQAGKTVISDRFLLANVVYQGHAGGLDISTLWDVGRVATQGVKPNLTIVLDLDPEVAAQRRQSAPDRLERRGLDYFRRVRAGFLKEASGAPDEIAVIDASRSADDVELAIQEAVERAALRGGFTT